MPLPVAPVGRGPWTPDAILGNTPEDHVRRELIDGWLYVDGQPVDDPMAEVAAESATPRHQQVVVELVLALGTFRAHHAGQLFVAPMDCLLDGQVLQPDVFWLDTEEPVGHPIELVPALVIEVSSPSTRRHDLVRKRRVYERAGVAEYWFVDLDALRIEQYVLTSEEVYDGPIIVDDGRLDSRALPGLQVDLESVLAPAVHDRR